MAQSQNTSTLSQIARNAAASNPAAVLAGAPFSGLREFVAEVTAADANGHTVAIVAPDGTLSAYTYLRVHTRPTLETMSVGARVMVVFDGQCQQPYIRLASGGGGGATTAVVTSALAYFTAG